MLLVSTSLFAQLPIVSSHCSTVLLQCECTAIIYVHVMLFSVSIRLLNTAQGSLLDDEKLVNALQSSKATAIEVQEQLEVSEQTEVKIDAAREVWFRYGVHVYVCVGFRGLGK